MQVVLTVIIAVLNFVGYIIIDTLRLVTILLMLLLRR